MNMIKIEGMVKRYNPNRQNAFEALRGVSMTIQEGELTAIVGKSGAGKSTLLHVMACIDNYEKGEYYLKDRLIWKLSERELASVRNQRIGMVMQDFALIDDFTAFENVMLPLSFSRKKMNKKQTVQKMLEDMGIPHLAKKQVYQLSGGEKQRVAIARALVNDPDIILADEPTGALDTKNTEMIMGILQSLNKRGKTIVIVTHERDIAEQCRRIITMSDGCIVSDTSA